MRLITTPWPFDKVIGKLAIMSCFLAVFATSPCHAESLIKKLNDSNITDFVIETAAMASGQDSEQPLSNMVEYLDKHLHKNARFKTTMAYNVPGFPPQETAMSIDKKEFIEKIENGEESLRDYKNVVDVKSINISSDKTKATVETTGIETGIMPIKEDGETHYVPVEGLSSCVQIILLNEGVIQMYNANCSTTITFTPY